MECWEHEEKREKFINDFYYEKLNFCGCGIPKDILFTVKRFLNAINDKFKRYDLEDYDSNRSYYYDLSETVILNSLSIKNDYEDNINFSVSNGVEGIVYNILNNCEVLEHGSSIFNSWLTDYGKELLKYLNELSDDDLDIILN